jgi:prevent-host-death family protein
MRKTTTRALRANLAKTMASVAGGQEIVVTRRGAPYVRMLPPEGKHPLRSYPLRGSVRAMADDFDAPLTELWAALDP